MTLSHHPFEAWVSRSSPPLTDPITAHLGSPFHGFNLHMSASFGALLLSPCTRSSANPGFLNLSTVAIWSWKFLFVGAGLCVAGSDAVLIEAQLFLMAFPGRISIQQPPFFFPLILMLVHRNSRVWELWPQLWKAMILHRYLKEEGY